MQNERYVLYSYIPTKDTILEIWGSSTKHPDCMYHFSDFRKSAFADETWQIPQWIFEIASRMNFPFHAIELAEYGLDLYEKLKIAAKYERGEI